MGILRNTGLVLLAALSSDATDGPSSQVPAGARAVELPELAPGELEVWREFALPSEDELTFDSFDWSPDLVAGLERSAEEQKPLLLWLMNGHPLGCT